MVKTRGEAKSQQSIKNPKCCKACHSNGFWHIGQLVPIGKHDAAQWKGKVIMCPWCGAGDVAEGDKWNMLVAHKKNLEDKDNG